MTAKEVINVYSSKPFYNTIATTGQVDLNLCKHQNNDEVGNMRQQIVYNKDKCFSYNMAL